MTIWVRGDKGVFKKVKVLNGMSIRDMEDKYGKGNFRI